MAGPLIWTERASSDIEAIVRYIARRNPKAATSIGLGNYHRAQLLLIPTREIKQTLAASAPRDSEPKNRSSF